MHYPPGKLAGQLRLVGGVQGAVGNHHASEVPALLMAIALGGDLPAAIVRRDAEYAGIEFVVTGQIKVLCVITKVALEFTVMRIQRDAVGHRKLGELGHAFGGDQVRRLVHGAVGVVDIPQAADVIVQLQTNEWDVELLQVASRGQAHGTGADNSVHGVCSRLSHCCYDVESSQLPAVRNAPNGTRNRQFTPCQAINTASHHFMRKLCCSRLNAMALPCPLSFASVCDPASAFLWRCRMNCGKAIAR